MENSKAQISVLVCTYNRSVSLLRTLRHIEKMKVPEYIHWELIIVDNNSKDDTRAVCCRFMENTRLKCKYFLEKTQGLSYARNCGISNASGEIIVFTDDDVIVDENWINHIYDAFNENQDVACIGGKILPIWEKPCPTWLKGILLDYIALCDLGNQELELDKPKVWGANLSVRKAMFQKHGMFETDFGHRGGKLYGGEEVRFLGKLLDGGDRIKYCPNVLVYHCIPESRMNKSYFRKWVSDKGELQGLQMGEYEKRKVFEIPYYIIRRTVMDFFGYVRSQIVCSENAFQDQLAFYYQLGIVKGRMKYRKDRRMA